MDETDNSKVFKRHLRWYKTGKLFVPLLLAKYSYKTDKITKLDEPSLILSNHLTESDMFMVGSAFREHVYFVCGEHLIRSKIGKFLKYAFDPITAPRGGKKTTTVKNIFKRLKAGHSVIMFPEGCRSFNGETLKVSEALPKLIKKAGCGLVTYRIHGGYFIAPRWAYNFRKGKASGEVVKVYSSAEIAQMSVEELKMHIDLDLVENAYSYQREHMYKYKGKKLAEGLENYLLICPKCGKYDSLYTKGNTFGCSCGLNGIYDEYGFLKGDNLPFDSVYDWGKWMEEKFDGDLASKSEDEILFTENNVTLYELLPDMTRNDKLNGTLNIYKNKMVIRDAALGEIEFQYNEIPEFSLLYFGKTFLFTAKTGYFGLYGDNFHAWKLNRCIEILSKIK